MKALIIYFTLGGRTKSIANAIAKSLDKYEVSYVTFEIRGKFREKLELLDKFRDGDYSAIEKNLNLLGSAEFDLLIIGMPTHGNFPPKAFDEIVDRMGDLSNKKVVVFNTARATGEKSLDYMEAKVKEAGAEVIDKKRFRGFIRLGIDEASKFGQNINEIELN